MIEQNNWILYTTLVTSIAVSFVKFYALYVFIYIEAFLFVLHKNLMEVVRVVRVGWLNWDNFQKLTIVHSTYHPSGFDRSQGLFRIAPNSGSGFTWSNKPGMSLTWSILRVHFQDREQFWTILRLESYGQHLVNVFFWESYPCDSGFRTHQSPLPEHIYYYK